MKTFNFLIILFIFFVPILIFCGEIQNQIYYEFPAQSVSHCVRRLNRSSVIGCSSKAEGNVGTVEIIKNQSDLFKLNEKSILVITADLFIKNFTDEFKSNKFIHGVIVIENQFCGESLCNDSTLNNPFSEDKKLPNKDFSFSLNHSFNNPGSNYGFINWPFPIAFLSKKYRNEQMKIISCYNKFNKDPSSNRRCSIEINNFMAAVKSAETSMRYQDIQNRFAGLFNPIQFYTDFTGWNYYVHTKKVVKSRKSNSTIVLLARTDSLSMFERSAVSVNGAVTSSALLLSVMKLLTSQPEFKTGENMTKDVLFIFLDNESYDYLGSSRFFYDLQNDNVAKFSSTPINASHLDLLLEFGELAYPDFSKFNFFYPYSFLKDGDKNTTLSYLRNLSYQFQRFGFQNASVVENYDLPPSSIQFMLRQRMMPSIVMADHQDVFKNPFYNSFLDQKREVNKSKELLAIVNAVASFIFKEATGFDLKENMSDSSPYSPSKIIECFSENLLCDLMKEILPMKTLSKLQALGMPIPTQAHSSTKDVPSDYRFSYILRNLIVFLSGEKTNSSFCKSCSSHGNCTWISSENDTQQCFKTKIDLFDEFSFNGTNIPLWLTSSIVDKQSIRMFVRGSNPSLLITGVTITLLPLFIMALLSPKISVIFSAYKN